MRYNININIAKEDIMKKAKRISAFAAALAVACSVPCSSFADDVKVEIFPETDSSHITLYPEKTGTVISRYIYGAADIGSLYKDNVTVLKQTGTALSSYNWETNYSNSGVNGKNINDVSLISKYPASKWSVPALYTDTLMSKSSSGRIPVRLAVLQMMGYAAKDSLGIVSEEGEARLSRWNVVRFTKNDTYLNQPDTSDAFVYTDEYVSYLVNRYGAAAEGGINGYFLDSEPDLWAENFPVLKMEPISPEELVDRSAELAASVKTIDSKAFIFGPSVSGLQGCINLGNPDAWNMTENSEYSWFIDYYLSEMRRESERLHTRLLDVLDIHYFTNATTPVGTPVLTAEDDYSNAYRMQAVRTLWDPDYTENSVTVLLNKQFTPVLPTLKASIRINYPGTRLSVSEYDFGGGGNISGAIAQIDALGTFAKENVYLACLAPHGDDTRFQEAGLKLFTDYDGEGGSFGRNYLQSMNDDEVMSSVHAAANDELDMIQVIVTNKNIVNDREFTINIDSDTFTYYIDEAYTIDRDTARIVSADTEDMICSENVIDFTAEPESVYMLVLRAEEPEVIPDSSFEGIWSTVPSETEETGGESAESETQGAVSESVTKAPHVSAEHHTEESFDDPAFETMPDIGEEITEQVTSAVTEVTSVTEISEASEDITEVTEAEPSADEDDSVPLPVKILISMLAAAVAIGVVYIIFFDRK